MPATCKAELIEVTTTEWDKLKKLVMQVDAQGALIKDADGVSMKDIIGHRAHWIALFLGWYHDGLAGKEVFFPAPGYKWNDLKRYNADLRACQASFDWDDVSSMLVIAHDSLVRFIERRSHEELYGAPMAGAKNQWTPGRWAEAAGPSHYRSAAKQLRARLKEQAASTSPVS